ncbi:RNA recognition motif [Gracilaria domingensis]|nr:RNA recognition motif [Gracilaria domingensis]
MNKVNVINNLNQTELEQGIAGTSASWHHKYISSDAIWVGGLSPSITEDRLLAILEQYGTVLHINLLRDANTSESKGYAFVRYADPRSCVLAVDNFTGFEIDGRSLRVDHVENYRMPEDGGLDTTPDGFHESQATDAANEHNSEAHAEESAAEKRRQKAVMERLESLRKRKRIQSTSQTEARDSKRRELSTHEDKPEPSKATQNTLIEETNHTTHATASDSYRRDKERRRREKEKRRQERARIRKRRAEKKAQQDQDSRG